MSQRIGADFRIVSGLELIKELIKYGVFGLKLVKGKVHFAGPEDYAIRYNPRDRSSKMSFGPFSPIKSLRFRELPHSFLPSYYWKSPGLKPLTNL